MSGVQGSAFPRNSSDIQQKALFDAISTGNVRAVDILLRRGVSANAPSRLYDSTPLSWAIVEKQTQIVQLLLARGAKLKGDDGITPLCLAAMAGNAAIVRLLLARGADVTPRTLKKGWTALDYARQFHPDLVPLFTQAKSKP
jgi:ankyrin repeat protein